MVDLLKLKETELLFRLNQAVEDPRDGLMLFGPLDEGKPFGIRWGVIGTQEGIQRFGGWVQKINKPIYDIVSESQPKEARPPFLGFETIFRTSWAPKPAIELPIPFDEILSCVYLEDPHQRVYKTVDLFSSRILKAVIQEDIQVDIWFVVIPDEIYKYCRPKSTVEKELKIKSKSTMTAKRANELKKQASFLDEDKPEKAKPYYFEVNFHNQLKARLLHSKALTQIIRESTIAPEDFPDQFGMPARKMNTMQASVAWNISTAVFYKCGGRPWKINGIRDGVCYIGIVFKQLPNSSNLKNACCAAQMFLDSGDGVVFKGNVGPWYNPVKGDYHLDQKSARELIQVAVESYQDKTGRMPSELFIHGKVDFNNDEWYGFQQAVNTNDTNLVGVRIREGGTIKLFRKAKLPVLRGTAYVYSKRKAFLWTKGYIPRLQTYPGREVPNPLEIYISRGFTDFELVLSDILALTKLNYNSCIFSDGVPVTLRFADAVGEILTAGPIEGSVPLPFKHYI